MKKFFSKLLLVLIAVIPCAVCFSACFGGRAKVFGVSVQLSGDEFVMVDNKISIAHGKEFELGADDFVVKAIYDDDSTKVLQYSSNDGYSVISTIPNDGVVPIGDYYLTFKYGKHETIITVSVVKPNINMDNVKWNYSSAFTYDKTEKEVKIVNLPDGVSVTYSGVTKATNAGEYSVTASFSASSEYGVIEDKTLTWKIEKAVLAVNDLEMNDFMYDESSKSATIKNVTLPENVVVKSILGEAAATNVGGYDVVVSFEHIGVDKDNYIVNDVQASWNITPGEYQNVGTISLNQTYDFTYDGTEKEVDVDFSELDNNVEIKSIVGDKATIGGFHDIIVELNYVGSNSNYGSAKSIVLVDAWEIKKAQLTIKANNNSATYGESVNAGSYEVSGFVNNETKDVLAGSVKFEYFVKGTKTPYVVGDNVGEYDIYITGLTSINYSINCEPGVLTVEKANVGSFASAALKVNYLTYNGQEQTIASELSDFEGLPAGVKIVSAFANTAKNCSENVAYVIFAQDDSGNYNEFVEQLAFDWSIIKKEVVVTINDAVITYGQEAVNNGYEIDLNDLCGEDILEVVEGSANYSYGEYVLGANVGTYSISIGADDLSAKNYSFKVVNGSLVVKQKEVSISGLTWCNVSNIVFNGEEKVVNLSDLPEGVVAEYSYLNHKEEIVDSLVSAGLYKAIVNLTELNDNYKIIDNFLETQKVFTIQKAIINVSSLELNNAASIIYDGEVKKPELVGLDELVVANYKYMLNETEIDPVDANDYSVVITFNVLDGNYRVDSESLTKKFVIQKAKIDASEFVWPYKYKYQYTGEAITPELLKVSDLVEVSSYTYKQDGEEINPVLVGRYVAEPNYAIKNSNYEIKNASSFEFEIVKASIKYPKLVGGNIQYFDSDTNPVNYYIEATVLNEDGYLPEFENSELFNILYSLDNGDTYTEQTISPIKTVLGYYPIYLNISFKNEDLYCFENGENNLETIVNVWSVEIVNANPFKELKFNGEDIALDYIYKNQNDFVLGDKLTYVMNDGYLLNGMAGSGEIIATDGYNIDKTYTITTTAITNNSSIVCSFNFNSNNRIIRELVINGKTFSLPSGEIEFTLDEFQTEVEITGSGFCSSVEYDASDFRGVFDGEINITVEDDMFIYFMYNNGEYNQVYLIVKIYKFSPIEKLNVYYVDSDGNVRIYEPERSGYSIQNSVVTKIEAIDVNGKVLKTKLFKDIELTQEVGLEDMTSIGNWVHVAAYNQEDVFIDSLVFQLDLSFNDYNGNYIDVISDESYVYVDESLETFSFNFEWELNISVTFNGETVLSLQDIVTKTNCRFEIVYEGTTYYFEKELYVVKSDSITEFCLWQPQISYGNKTYYISEEIQLFNLYDFIEFKETFNNYVFNFKEGYFESSKEICEFGDGYYLKLCVLDGSGKDYMVYLPLIFDGEYDDNTNISASVENIFNGVESEVVVENDKITITNHTIEYVYIYFENHYASAVIKDNLGNVLKESSNNNISYFFENVGEYILVVTASNGTTKEYTIVVQEAKKVLEVEVSANGKEYVFVSELDEELDFVGDFMVGSNGLSFDAYIEDFESIPQIITINSVSSIIMESTRFEFYLDKELTQRIFNINDSISLVVKKDADLTTYAAFYAKCIDMEDAVYTIRFIFGEKVPGELMFSFIYDDVKMAAYMNSEDGFVGDFYYDEENTIFIGSLDCENFNEDVIVFDFVNVPFFNMAGDEYFVVDFASALNAEESNDESLLKFIDFSEGILKENCELGVCLIEDVRICGVIVSNGEFSIQILITIGAELEI